MPCNLHMCLFQISLVIIFIFAVIIYRTLASIWLFSSPTTRPMAQLFSSTSGAIVSQSKFKCSSTNMGRKSVIWLDNFPLDNWKKKLINNSFPVILPFELQVFQPAKNARNLLEHHVIRGDLLYFAFYQLFCARIEYELNGVAHLCAFHIAWRHCIVKICYIFIFSFRLINIWTDTESKELSWTIS